VQKLSDNIGIVQREADIIKTQAQSQIKDSFDSPKDYDPVLKMRQLGNACESKIKGT
jgi:hypothetical protein